MMNKWPTVGFVVSLVLLVLLQACNPKTSKALQEKREEAIEKDTATQVKGNELSECVKFSDIANTEEAIEAYVLYRDFFKLNEFDQAYPYWKKAYTMAPAADGKRYSVFTDGVYIFEHKIEQTEDSSLIYSYIDTIFTLYDEAIECYPDYDGFLSGRKAYDMFYKYPESHSKSQQFEYFRHAVEQQDTATPAFIINPFTSLIVSQFKAGELDTADARKWARKVQELIEYSTRGGEVSESWAIVEKYSTNKLEDLEAIEGFYECDYYKEKYLFPYLDADNPDCETALQTYSKLRWGGCSEEDSVLVSIEQRLKSECDLIPGGASSLAEDAFAAMREGKYSTAIKLFNQAKDQSEDTERKANYALMNAKIYYAYIKDFPTSRRYALEAADYKGNWGEPYILIGKLYASSGPLCGPGRGWDSQVVIWPAIDKWNRAMEIDPSVAREARSLIDEYWQYMPTNENISQRLHKEGDEFFVNCWIKETTTIRTSRSY